MQVLLFVLIVFKQSKYFCIKETLAKTLPFSLWSSYSILLCFNTRLKVPEIKSKRKNITFLWAGSFNLFFLFSDNPGDKLWKKISCSSPPPYFNFTQFLVVTLYFKHITNNLDIRGMWFFLFLPKYYVKDCRYLAA